MSKKKILFLTGSENQTTQMHAIAKQLPDYDCFFSQSFGDTVDVIFWTKMGWLEDTILSGHFKSEAEAYIEKNGLEYDYWAKKHKYDLVIHCTDMVVPHKLRKTKSIWVQEGMTDPVTPWARFTKKLGLPGYFAMNTSMNGTSNLVDIYCCASEGYKQHFVKLGAEADRFFPTGIPNYDNAQAYCENNFPHKDYVLVVTSDNREMLNEDDREEFIAHATKIANGRQMIFKLHPNEDFDRAIPEIQQLAPEGTLIYTTGNAHEMVANCAEYVGQYSTLVYTALSLGKPVSAYFDTETLKAQTPIQNGGDSARRIADIVREYIEYNGTGKQFLAQYKPNFLDNKKVAS